MRKLSHCDNYGRNGTRIQDLQFSAQCSCYVTTLSTSRSAGYGWLICCLTLQPPPSKHPPFLYPLVIVVEKAAVIIVIVGFTKLAKYITSLKSKRILRGTQGWVSHIKCESLTVTTTCSDGETNSYDDACWELGFESKSLNSKSTVLVFGFVVYKWWIPSRIWWKLWRQKGHNFLSSQNYTHRYTINKTLYEERKAITFSLHRIIPISIQSTKLCTHLRGSLMIWR